MKPVYIALSRANGLEGLHLANAKDAFAFCHTKGSNDRILVSEMQHLDKVRLQTVYGEAKQCVAEAKAKGGVGSLFSFNIPHSRR